MQNFALANCIMPFKRKNMKWLFHFFVDFEKFLQILEIWISGEFILVSCCRWVIGMTHFPNTFLNGRIQIMEKKRHWKISSFKTIQLKNRNPQSRQDNQITPTQQIMEDGQHLENQVSKQAQFQQQAFMILHLLDLTQEKLSTIQMNHLSGLKTILEAL